MGTLVERINAAAAGIKSAPRGFEARLSPDVREQLLEIRRQWQSGHLQVSACWLADQIVAMAAADGFAVCGRQGLRVWLANRDSSTG